MVRPWVVLQKTGAKVRRMKRPGLFAIIIANWIQWQQQLPLGEYSVQNSRIPPAGSEKFCLENKSEKLRSFLSMNLRFLEHFYPFTTIPREILCIMKMWGKSTTILVENALVASNLSSTAQWAGNAVESKSTFMYYI